MPLSLYQAITVGHGAFQARVRPAALAGIFSLSLAPRDAFYLLTALAATSAPADPPALDLA